jgi:hypothetical protein
LAHTLPACSRRRRTRGDYGCTNARIGFSALGVAAPGSIVITSAEPIPTRASLRCRYPVVMVACEDVRSPNRSRWLIARPIDASAPSAGGLPEEEIPGHGSGWTHYLARLQTAIANGNAGPDPGMSSAESTGSSADLTGGSSRSSLGIHSADAQSLLPVGYVWRGGCGESRRWTSCVEPRAGLVSFSRWRRRS